MDAVGQRGTDGFTLLEMLLVLVLAALAIGLLVPRLTMQAHPPAPEAVKFLEKERGRAIQDGKPVWVYYEANELVADPNGDRLKLEQRQSLDILHPPASPYFSRRLVTVFYPDGTLLLSEIMLLQDTGLGTTREIDRITLNPLHGEIAYVPR
jgi:prepilin-type N-terminal cleavage/methylation domain-containing protein